MSSVLEEAEAANQVEAETPEADTDLIFTTLSKHKIATFAECDDKGVIKENSPVIQAIFIDGNTSYESQWQTPFENSNPEHKLPTLMAGIQSGQILESVGGAVAGSELAKTIVEAMEFLDPVTGKLKQTLQGLEGKTNLTKVNSQQIFLSTASVKKTLTVFFIAIYDAKKEVENKVKQLEAWSLPVELSESGMVENVAANGLGGLFPSTIPPYVSVTIHNKTYAPFIIESISSPINAPIDENGNRLNLTVDLNIMSRTAWDSRDILNVYGN